MDLQKLDVSFHLVSIEDLVKSHQAMNGLTNRRALWGIHDAAIGCRAALRRRKSLSCEKHALFSTGSLHMRGIGCAEDVRLTHCFDIDVFFAQAFYNGSANVFVEIESNFSRHSACA